MRRPLAVMLALVLAASTWIGLGAVAASELGPPPAFEGVLEGTAPPPSHLEAAPAIGAAVVNTASRSDVVAFFTSTYMASQGIATDWTGNHAACVAGATSPAYADATLRRVAYFRAMAGVPASIVLDGSLSAKAQSAALMMSAQGALSHNPSPSFTCYSAGGAEAARKSNLALGVTGPDAVSLYMDDPGAGNYFVGHRRWVLHPPQATMGTGSVPAASGKPAANALWVLAPFGPRPSLPDGVAWPPRGFVPYQAMPTTSNRWSFSYPGADFSHASVTMTRGGATVPVTIEAKVNDQGYGDNTLVWRPQEYTAGRPAVDTTYSVAIGNAVIEGAARSFAYEVTVIDPAAPPPPPAVFAAVLPSSRSVQVGTPATAFATMINAGTTSLTGCRISLATSIPAELMYQTTNAVTNVVTGTPNTPVTIPPGGSQSFVIVITPTAAIAPVEVALGFRCDGDVSAPVTNGVNTLLLSASTTPVPDVIALAATPSADGIVRIAGPGATGAFAVATSNVGEEASVTVIADTGGTPLPLTIGICETHPATGACQTATAPSVTTLVGPGATPTFAVFVTPTGPVPFDPASHRIFVRFQHAGATRGSTSVAVMSVPPSYALALLTAGTGSGTATGGAPTLQAPPSPSARRQGRDRRLPAGRGMWTAATAASRWERI